MAQTIAVSFRWHTTSADPRQFQQQRQLLEPIDVRVVVEVPLEDQYFTNVEKLKDDLLVHPNLTPAGMAYAISKLEEPFQDKPVRDDEFEFEEGFANEDEWETEETEAEQGDESPPWEEEDAFSEGAEFDDIEETNDDEFEWE